MFNKFVYQALTADFVISFPFHALNVMMLILFF